MNRTEVASLGEFGLIERLTNVFSQHDRHLKRGIGDDAMHFEAGEGKEILLSTDMLVEGIHFDLAYNPLKHLGYKAVSVNLSDLYAMNGKPRYLTFSLAISNRFSVEALEELYAGIAEACKRYEVLLTGGDTTSSPSGLFISVTVVGEVEKGKAVYRNGAKTGDIVCVTGDLGAAYLGLQLLEREKRVFQEHPDIQPDLSGREYIVGRQIKAEARKDMIEFFTQHDILPTAMIDVSDGLSSDIMHICKQSGTGVRLYESDIPIHDQAYHQALEFKIDPITAALNGGEDYELLFTIRKEDKELLTEFEDVSFIGEIVEKEYGMRLITKGNKEHLLRAQGWQSF